MSRMFFYIISDAAIPCKNAQFHKIIIFKISDLIFCRADAAFASKYGIAASRNMTNITRPRKIHEILSAAQ
jgi:hypothetical protein